MASDLLCEHCGYVLNGLLPGANCPECGNPAADSSPDKRTAPAWESADTILRRFYKSTTRVLFRPQYFYRTFATRLGRDQSKRFAWTHWLLASALFGWTGFVHGNSFYYLQRGSIFSPLLESPLLGIPVLTAIVFCTLIFVNNLAARLTAWEARYRELRLPLPVVLRSLDYHAAHYVPVALLGLSTVVGYRLLHDYRILDFRSDVPYLYVLCGEVIIGATYLFVTYWTAMRSIMYANA